MTESVQETQATAPYSKVDSLSQVVLDTLMEQGASVGYGMLACALTLGRLVNVGKSVLEDEEEVKWIEDCLDFATGYFTSSKQGGN